jgi:hypothetical protein
MRVGLFVASVVTMVGAQAPSTTAQTPVTFARDYWFFKLPVQAPVPSHPTLANPIDRFVEAARRAHGLEAAPRASRSTLVRRAYLDLLGLPPTPSGATRHRSSRSRSTICMRRFCTCWGSTTADSRTGTTDAICG